MVLQSLILYYSKQSSTFAVDESPCSPDLEWNVKYGISKLPSLLAKAYICHVRFEHQCI